MLARSLRVLVGYLSFSWVGLGFVPMITLYVLNGLFTRWTFQKPAGLSVRSVGSTSPTKWHSTRRARILCMPRVRWFVRDLVLMRYLCSNRIREPSLPSLSHLALIFLLESPRYNRWEDFFTCLFWLVMFDKPWQIPCILPGKRRYDRKQSGYGGQTKPIFRKKVRNNYCLICFSHWPRQRLYICF